MELDAMTSAPNNMRNQQAKNTNRKQDDLRRGARFYCHATGHRAAECPQKTNNSQGKTSPSRAFWSSTRDKTYSRNRGPL
ncbi:hypothetical protein BCR41DRAFT_362488 [Lobosporangium transversale]|uniref:CCHC-type domain-containing protein n=1 Tax=Lobosporangium transversale TaxID=64571 RepID=A0A1Y2G999_9FUNG|nr:hypothetical protein BCR41DRAFT_362488 [Lobosporangium transversale]ORZ04680.1 hypothetical protein BCR41DRAFT_362488 [Lobosporangium transversale]|eukprot:XP_021876677.1 hypothetical protein BCR41DRAFT_362488 [Lobosporangium transversale]